MENLKEKLTDLFNIEGNKIEIKRIELLELLNDLGYGIADNSYKPLQDRLIKQESNVLTTISTKDLSRSFLNLLKENIDDKRLVEKFLRGIGNYISSKTIEQLPEVKVNLLKDTRDKAYFPFFNGVVEVSADKMKIIKYDKLSKKVLKSAIINKEVDVNFSYEDGQFYEFCKLICGNNSQKLLSLQTIIGYLVHNNKESKENKIAIFYDKKIGNKSEAHGGTGKTLLINEAIRQLRNIAVIDGKNYTGTKSNKFLYQNVEHDTQIILFDDVCEAFNLQDLFATSTSGISTEKKNKQSVYLKDEDAPKLAVTSNQPVKMKHGSSAERRKIDFYLENFFTDKNTPEKHFGNLFFCDDWDKWEYLRFYNFMFGCVQYYLKFGLIKDEDVKVNDVFLKALIGEKLFEFFDIDMIELIGEPFSKQELYYGISKNIGKHSPHIITKKLNLYCYFKNIDIQIINKNSKQTILLKYKKQSKPNSDKSEGGSNE